MFCTFIKSNQPRKIVCKNKGCGNYLLTNNPPENCKAECNAPIAYVRAYQKPINFAKALIKYYASGRKKVTKEQYEQRLAVCNECKYRDPKNNKCTICGCKVKSKLVINKAILPHENCPVGKWPRLLPDDAKQNR